MENIKGKIIGVLVVLGLVAYFLLFYPLIVKTVDGETQCESVLGLSVKCDWFFLMGDI